MKPSDGYFLAKRQLQEALAYRLSTYEQEIDILEKDPHDIDAYKYQTLKAQIKEINDIRNFVRNSMLWDTKDGE